MDFKRDRFAPDGSFESAVARINVFKPDLIRAYASHVGPLFRWAWERRVPLFRPKVVVYGGDSIPDADGVLIEPPGLVQVRVIQEELRNFRLLAVCAAGTDWDSTCSQLAARMRAMIGDDIALEIEQLDVIVPEPGGKVRAVISHCWSREA
jgi:hypothetical protein